MADHAALGLRQVRRSGEGFVLFPTSQGWGVWEGDAWRSGGWCASDKYLGRGGGGCRAFCPTLGHLLAATAEP
jgi:hypothetical protein